ncbi:hypothetical protein [Propionivibrio sp.]|uniref:hypothetical protein n=1 Tax=Propionivibrio sp. TaxID=2212460 RepID=UPI002628D6C5|nr:hypothetical protein [Propionivibrio sp.]
MGRLAALLVKTIDLVTTGAGADEQAVVGELDNRLRADVAAPGIAVGQPAYLALSPYHCWTLAEKPSRSAWVQ